MNCSCILKEIDRFCLLKNAFMYCSFYKSVSVLNNEYYKLANNDWLLKMMV